MKENDFFLPPKKKNGDVVLFMFLFFLLLPGFSIAQYKAQLNIDIKNIIYIQNKLYKSFKDSSNVVILNEKNIRKINSILFMVINHEN